MKRKKRLTKKFFTPRLIIYSCLIIAFLLTLYLSTLNIEKYSWWKDFLINLSAGFVGTLITVTLVDYFVFLERNLKFNAINQPVYDGFLIYIRVTMMDIMADFKYINKKDKNISNLEGSKAKFRTFIEDKATIQKLDNLSNYKIETLNFIQKTAETFKSFQEHVSKSFKEFVPYANPAITQAVTNELVEFESALKAYSAILEGALVVVPKKSKSFQKDESIFNKGMRVLWNMAASGETNPQKKSLKSLYLDNFELILDLEEKARKKHIHFDI